MGTAGTPRKLRYLIITGLSSTFIYAAVMLQLRLDAMYATTLRNLNRIPLSEWPFGVLVVVCLALLFVSYALGAVLIPWLWHKRTAQLALIGFPVAFVGLVLATFPITSTDLYDYLFRGWMLAHYHANTFVVPPQILANDPLLPYVAWPWAVTAYGPLWERISWGVAWLASEVPGAANAETLLLHLLLGYKVLNVVGFVLCGVAIWAALGGADPRWRWQGLYLWLWNPLVLWETVGAGHNDVWMALPVVLALWAIRLWQETPRHHDLAQRIAPMFALLALTAGGLVKFIALFFGPLVLAAVLRDTLSWRAQLRLIAITGGACLLLVVMAYVPFWAGWDTLRNIGDRGELYTSSWLASLRSLLANSLGMEQANSFTSLLGLGLLLAGVVWTTWNVWREPQHIAEEVLKLTLWFLLVCNPWFQPWYLVWAVALVAVMPWWRRLAWVTGAFCATAMIGYIVGALVLPVLQLDQPPFLRDLLVSLWLYVPPLIGLFVHHRQPTGQALTRPSGSAIIDAVRPRSSGG